MGAAFLQVKGSAGRWLLGSSGGSWFLAIRDLALVTWPGEERADRAGKKKHQHPGRGCASRGASLLPSLSPGWADMLCFPSTHTKAEHGAPHSAWPRLLKFPLLFPSETFVFL